MASSPGSPSTTRGRQSSQHMSTKQPETVTEGAREGTRPRTITNVETTTEEVPGGVRSERTETTTAVTLVGGFELTNITTVKTVTTTTTSVNVRRAANVPEESVSGVVLDRPNLHAPTAATSAIVSTVAPSPSESNANAQQQGRSLSAVPPNASRSHSPRATPPRTVGPRNRSMRPHVHLPHICEVCYPGRRARKGRAGEMVVPQPRVVIDHSSFPHIVGAILSAAQPKVLLAFRATSRAMRNAVDVLLLRHLTVDQGSLRTRVGNIWLQDEDDRILEAEFLDLGRGLSQSSHLERMMAVNAPSLSRLRMIRIKEQSFKSWEFCDRLCRAADVGWITQFLNATATHPKQEALKVHAPRIKAGNTARVVFNIRYSPWHERFSETELSLPMIHGDASTYILLTPEQRDPAVYMAGEIPPPRAQVLNTLIQSLFVAPMSGTAFTPREAASKIVFVGTETWDPTWLNHKFYDVRRDYTNSPQLTFDIRESLPRDTLTSLPKRIRWWIGAFASAVGYTAPQAGWVLDRVKFLSLDEFRASVNDDDLFDRMAERQWWRRRELRRCPGLSS